MTTYQLIELRNCEQGRYIKAVSGVDYYQCRNSQHAITIGVDSGGSPGSRPQQLSWGETPFLLPQ